MGMAHGDGEGCVARKRERGEYSSGQRWTGLKHTVEVPEPSHTAPSAMTCLIDLTDSDTGGSQGLDNQEHAVVAFAELITQGTETQIEQHIESALDGGVLPGKIVEAIAQLISREGLPHVLRGLLVANRVLRKRGLGGIGAARLTR